VKARLLIVDDEESIRDSLAIILEREGYETDTAADGVDALERFKRKRADVVLVDIRMPKMDGITLLKNLKEIDPDLIVIILTAFSTWDSAVNAMRLGAYDYIKKPFDTDQIKAIVARAVEQNRFVREERSGDIDFTSNMIVGNTRQMQEVANLIRRVAPTESTVLIEGESGTGKELVARLLHLSSMRSRNPFITVNCSAFPETLLESELFGHVKGAFTNAICDKKGLLEVAEGGTFFLDEVGELTPQTQVKLLRVLEEKKFKPVGSTETKKVDVRFITATNRNLEEEVQKGNFREDLFFRLNVIPIRLPPLRERREDIPLFVGHFLARYSKLMNREVKGVAREAMEALMAYDWPGNVRELENTIQRAVALSEGDEITLKDLPEKFRVVPEAPKLVVRDLPAADFNLEKEIEKIERYYLQHAMELSNWNMTKAAQLLGLSFRSMRYKVQKYGLKVR